MYTISTLFIREEDILFYAKLRYFIHLFSALEELRPPNQSGLETPLDDTKIC